MFVSTWVFACRRQLENVSFLILFAVFAHSHRVTRTDLQKMYCTKGKLRLFCFNNGSKEEYILEYKRTRKYCGFFGLKGIDFGSVFWRS